MWVLIALILATAGPLLASLSFTCPPLVCSCSEVEQSANCSSRGLLKPPPGLPLTLVRLDLSRNDLSSVDASEIFRLTNLEELDLSFNMLTEVILPGAHYNLLKLDLSSNNISTVRSLQIEGLVHLAELNLANNKIIILPADAFPGGTFLRWLNLKSNRIVSLEPGCISNLTSLETLILTRNKLSSFPKALFDGMKSLQVLELNKNKFVEIQGLTFHGLDNLKILRFKRNKIEFLLDGAFYGLYNIEELSLDHNKVNRVNKGWLYGLVTLRYLSLAHNSVDFVDEDAWEFCKVLDELDLRSNKLQLLDRLTLSRLPTLKHLYLQNNKISHIEGGAGNYDSRSFADVPLLETLALDGNEISHTIEDMEAPFNGLTNLKELSLSNNLIKSIGNQAFMGLDLLEALDVRDNIISTVQENAFSHLSHLKTIHMNSGSILCDCYLKWFPKWLNDTPSVDRGNVIATCAHPEQLKDQLITFVPYESYTCDDFPKPYILKQPETQITLHGANLTLRCRAASTSPAEMSFQWKVDSDIVEADESDDCADRCVRYHAHSYDGKGREITAELHLTNLIYDDAGRYQCVVSNKFGATYSERANITVYVYPTFVVTPEDITVVAGASANMKCAASGVPAPEVFWTKDSGTDFHAAIDRRINVNSFQAGDDRLTNVNSFVIRNVKAIDMGIYTCTAKNPAGLVSWNITLSVEETPRFVKPMEDEVVIEGDTAVIECMASGSPKPLLTWVKDGRKLEPTERHFFAADNQLLIVVKARLSDAGRYECSVHNPLGTQNQSSILKVNSFTGIVSHHDNGGSINESDQTTGIVLVTVVCCIVGTSLVMVVMYMCRQRLNRSRQPHCGRGTHAYGSKGDGLPLAPDDIPMQRPMIISGHHSDSRRGSHNARDDYLNDGGAEMNREDESHPSFDDTSIRMPTETELSFPSQMMLDKNRLLLQNVIHDSSSERDSGTGDSRKSRDNVDEEEVGAIADDSMVNSVLATFLARQGGGESTISLTDFEATGVTNVDDDDDMPYADDDDDEADGRGCGETLLSASNSIAAGSDKSSSNNSNDGGGQTRTSDIVNLSTPVSFRTFHPTKKVSSLSRDCLNASDQSDRGWRRMGGSAKKRASAIELNGECYLAIEALGEEDPAAVKSLLEPSSVYRGGAASKRLNGLEFNERLLAQSLNATDYSLHQSQLVRNSRERASQQKQLLLSSSYVNSLPRKKRKDAKNKKLLLLLAAAKPPDHSDVAFKDNEMFT